MARKYKLGSFRRGFNLVAEPAIRLGLAPAGTYILTTSGRKTGIARSNPVQLIEDGDDRWLVAPYGVVSWVLNARAAGTVELTRGRRHIKVSIHEVSPDEAAPILKRYVAKVPIVLPYFDAKRSAPEAEFAKEASRHPVFRLS